MNGQEKRDFFLMIPCWWGASKTNRGKGRCLSHTELSIVIFAFALRAGGDGIHVKKQDVDVAIACAFNWSLDFSSRISTGMIKRGYFKSMQSGQKCLQFVFTEAGEELYKDVLNTYLDRAQKLANLLDMDRKGIRFKVRQMYLDAQV